MKRLRMMRAGLFAVLAVGGMSAQPEKMLVDAVDRLWTAGNYSWEKGTVRFVDGRRDGGRALFPDVGETIIGGFTHARVSRQEMVYRDREVVFLTKNGWRHTDDLTAADFSPPAPGVRSRIPKPPLVAPHKILRLLLQYGRNLRAQGIAVEGDLALSPEGWSALNSDGISGGFPSRGPQPGKSVTFVVWIERGDITEFSVEFANTVILLNDPDGKERRTNSDVPTIRLTKIGTTQVEIDPQAKALFLSVAEKP